MSEMQDKSDAQLLREYAKRECEPAFREIVTRHTDLVLRYVNSSDLACDIAQSVFSDLSRKARPLAEKLADNASLVGRLQRPEDPYRYTPRKKIEFGSTYVRYHA